MQWRRKGTLGILPMVPFETDLRKPVQRTWSVRDAPGVRQSENSLPYDSWLKFEITFITLWSLASSLRNLGAISCQHVIPSSAERLSIREHTCRGFGYGAVPGNDCNARTVGLALTSKNSTANANLELWYEPSRKGSDSMATWETGPIGIECTRRLTSPVTAFGSVQQGKRRLLPGTKRLYCASVCTITMMVISTRLGYLASRRTHCVGIDTREFSILLSVLTDEVRHRWA